MQKELVESQYIPNQKWLTGGHCPYFPDKRSPLHCISKQWREKHEECRGKGRQLACSVSKRLRFMNKCHCPQKI